METKVPISVYQSEDLFFAVAISPVSGKILRIFLPTHSKEKLENQITSEFADFELTEKYQYLAEEMFKIYNGQIVDFNLDILELSCDKSNPLNGPVSSEFYLKTLEVVLEIPRGEVRTYKEVAESLGSNAWRAVGSAMGKNPFPLVIPCHRVVKSDLSLGNYGGGVEMKKELLIKEGVNINGIRVVRP